MSRYRHHLPQLDGGLFLTDGGIETTLIFHDGLELPSFAVFPLLREETGTSVLRQYFRRHAAIARQRGLGFVLESPTWRANPDWGQTLGYGPGELDDANRRAIALMEDVREADGEAAAPLVISGCLGPRGDGYDPGAVMTPDEAEAYHTAQIQVFADTGADLATALTMTNAAEAIGITRAASAAGLPVVISFTLETDGRLPTGQALDDAIDEALTY